MEYKEIISQIRGDSRLDRISLLTVGGSEAYGTSLNEKDTKSDLDIRGFHYHTKSEIYTMNCVNKPYVFNDGELDVVIFPLKQLFNLLAECNPGAFEILGTKQEHILYKDDVAKILLDNKELFISQLVFYKFGGYATSLLRRLEMDMLHNPIEDKKIDTLQKSLNNLIKGFESKFNIKLEVKTTTSTSEGTLITGNLQEKPLCDVYRIMGDIMTVHKNYTSMKGRTRRKKTKEDLYKHAMHTIRSLKMGIELLQGKGIITYRGHDRDFLLDIRKGIYTFDEIFTIANDLDKELNQAMKSTSIPVRPDYHKLDVLLMEMVRISINKQKVDSTL